MRVTTIQPRADGSVTAQIALIRDERRRIDVSGFGSASLMLTIAADPAAAPLIEIPGTGSFDLHPAAVQILTEGGVYDYNIWSRDGSADLIQIAAGQMTIGPSIAPTGVDQATTFLAGFGQEGGPSHIVTLTRAAYLALAVKVPDTIYIIVEDVA